MGPRRGGPGRAAGQTAATPSQDVWQAARRRAAPLPGWKHLVGAWPPAEEDRGDPTARPPPRPRTRANIPPAGLAVDSLLEVLGTGEVPPWRLRLRPTKAPPAGPAPAAKLAPAPEPTPAPEPAPAPEIESPAGPAPAAKFAPVQGSGAALPAQTACGTGSEVLLQAFNWESCREPGGWWNRLSAEAGDFAKAGFTAVWLPPCTDSVSPEGYLPQDLYNLDSKFGSAAELKTLVGQLRGLGMLPVADAVLNHRCASGQNEHGVWNQFGGRLDWDAHAIVSDDPNFSGRGGRSSGENFHAAPNIDHGQDFVKRDLSEWLLWLKEEVGFQGLRMDYVKGFAGHHVGDYVRSAGPTFSVGEYWDALEYGHDGRPAHCQDGHRQRIINWINSTGAVSGAFDFTTKGILHAAFEAGEFWRLRDRGGKMPGVAGWWPSRSVTILENHDTGSTQSHWPFPRGWEQAGYAYILTHPGTPCVFYDHMKCPHLADAVKRMVQLRKEQGLHCRSSLSIEQADSESYAAVVDEKVAVRIGHGGWSPAGGGWQVAFEGDRCCAWTRPADTPAEGDAAGDDFERAR